MSDKVPTPVEALISELNSQIIRLPAAEPDAVDRMMAALSLRLEALAQHVNERRPVDRDALEQAQILLGVYAQQLGKAIHRVQRGLELFNLAAPVYGDAAAPGPGRPLPASINPRSYSA